MLKILTFNFIPNDIFVKIIKNLGEFYVNLKTILEK